MPNKVLNTRIQSKYDTYANWQSANPVLLKGELAVVVVPASASAVQQEPAILFKVGDGVKNFNDLGWTSATAADVYDWAKASSKPSYTASEISGISEAITSKVTELNLSVDTNTQYKIDFNGGKVRLFSKEKGVESFGSSPVATAEIPTYSLTTGTTNGTIKFNNAEVAVAGLGSAAYKADSAFDAAGAATTAEANAKSYADGLAKNYDAAGTANTVKTDLESKIGAVASGKTVVGMIAEAQTAATYDDSALKARVKTLEDDTRVATLVGEDTGKSARAIANEELAKQLIPANAKDSLDTLGEIAAWIQKHPDDASAMNQKISALETAVGEGGSVSTQIDNKIAALDLENAYDVKGAAAAAQTAAQSYADGLATNYDAKGAATSAENNAKAYADGLAANYDAKGAAASAQTAAISAAATDAASKYVAKVAGKGLSTNDFDAAAKSKLDGIAEGAQVNKIESIKVNGVAQTIADDKSVDLTVPTKIEDLGQDNYVVFNCGSATINIEAAN